MKKGFTFIETMVTVGVLGLVLPVVFAILFAIIQQQLKTYRISEVKRQGDYVINVMETKIRSNAVSTHNASPPSLANQECITATGTDTDISYFIDKNDAAKWFGYTSASGKISIESSEVAEQGDLTTSKVRIEDFSLTCTRSASYSAPIIKVSFTVCYNNGVACATAGRVEEVASLTYKTNIKLRNQ